MDALSLSVLLRLAEDVVRLSLLLVSSCRFVALLSRLLACLLGCLLDGAQSKYNDIHVCM